MSKRLLCSSVEVEGGGGVGGKAGGENAASERISWCAEDQRSWIGKMWQLKVQNNWSFRLSVPCITFYFVLESNMAVIPPSSIHDRRSINLESPVKPSMEIFKIPYPDDFFDEDIDVIKYPLSSTTNTNSSMNDIEVSQRQKVLCLGNIIWLASNGQHDIARAMQSTMNNAFIVSSSIISSWQIDHPSMMIFYSSVLEKFFLAVYVY